MNDTGGRALAVGARQETAAKLGVGGEMVNIERGDVDRTFHIAELPDVEIAIAGLKIAMNRIGC